MLKQIKIIQNIGVFKDYDAKKANCSHEFGKFNLIYGLNAYGKSTLCDVLKDMNTGNDLRIIDRTTIPKDKVPSVVISSDQGIHSYKNGKWNNNLLNNKFMFFDSEFVINNVFAGEALTNDRVTKENFTSFILGEEGVKLANKIEELKEQQKENRSKLKDSVPNSQNGKTDAQIKRYVNLTVNETEEELTHELNEKNQLLEAKKKQLANKNFLQNYKLIQEASLCKIDNLIESINQIVDILKKTYDLNEENLKDFEKHIRNFCNDDSNAQQWISQGLKYLNNSGCCPFCEQKIQDENLINSYRSVLDEDYFQFEADIKKSLDNNQYIDFNVFDAARHAIQVIKVNKDAIQKFQEGIIDCTDETEHILADLNSIEQNIHETSNELQKTINRAAIAKRQMPYASLTIDPNQEFAEIRKYKDTVIKLNDVINKLNESIKEKKHEISNEKADDVLNQLSSTITNINQKLTRIHENNNCVQWKAYYNKVQDLTEQINAKSKELETNQSSYLRTYFDYINCYFKCFGSRDFKIEPGDISNRGKKKVIGIKVLFKGQQIDNLDKTKCLFSESDRRALAMAVFMAKVKEIENKSNLIIVMDDPITSFDENRISVVSEKLYEMSLKVDQLFVFTHHFMFARNIFNVYKNNVEYFEICKVNCNSNGILEMNPSEKLAEGFEKAYLKISKFNSGDSENITENDLRTFIEEYLKIIFAKQYQDWDLYGMKLSDAIDKLSDELHVIGNNTKLQLHNFRKMLNPDSHMFSESNVEDKRSLSNEIVDYLFNHVVLQD